jgi:hypothetical protein
MGCLILGGVFFAILSHKTEHVTVRNNIKLVACVDYFSGVTVNYYQYKNPFFTANGWALSIMQRILVIR